MLNDRGMQIGSIVGWGQRTERVGLSKEKKRRKYLLSKFYGVVTQIGKRGVFILCEDGKSGWSKDPSRLQVLSCVEYKRLLEVGVLKSPFPSPTPPVE